MVKQSSLILSFLLAIWNRGDAYCITDKQFGQIELFLGKKPQTPNAPGQQLELF